MELGRIDHPQTQREFKVPSTSQTTTTSPDFHDPAAAPYHSRSSSSFIDHKAFFDSLPPGYRFRPTKVELIKDYLLPKINKKILPPSHIRDANLYEDCPEKITERYKADENEWYFFTPRDRKYPNGRRPNRAAGNGYWKATGADVKIMYNGKIIGFKKSLVYFTDKPPNGEKTNWIMHEYRALDSDKPRKKTASMRLDDYVLCRIHIKKNDLSTKGQDSGTPSTSVKECNSISAMVSDSSRMMKNDLSTKGKDGSTPSTSVKECNSISAMESDSSRMMDLQEGTLMMDASSGHDKFSCNFLAKEEIPLNYVYGYGYELPSSHQKKEEFEDLSSLDLDNYFFSTDYHPSPNPSKGSCLQPPLPPL